MRTHLVPEDKAVYWSPKTLTSLSPGAMNVPQIGKSKYKFFLFAPSFLVKIRLSHGVVWQV